MKSEAKLNTAHSSAAPVDGAMIFAAGLGTRFKPWTDTHPKALAMVNGKSLLQRNVEYLQQFGIRKVVVNVHHFADQVIAALRDNNGWGSDVFISNEQNKLLETGGGLLNARDFFNGKFITCNADVLTDLDINQLIAFHETHKPLISFGVTVRETSRYFLFDEKDRLCGWRNKKTGQERIVIPGRDLIEKAYSTVVVFEPEIFSLIPYRGRFSLVDVYLELSPRHLILGYDHTGDRFVDVGKPENIAIAESIFP